MGRGVVWVKKNQKERPGWGALWVEELQNQNAPRQGCPMGSPTNEEFGPRRGHLWVEGIPKMPMAPEGSPMGRMIQQSRIRPRKGCRMGREYPTNEEWPRRGHLWVEEFESSPPNHYPRQDLIFVATQSSPKINSSPINPPIFIKTQTTPTNQLDLFFTMINVSLKQYKNHKIQSSLVIRATEVKTSPTRSTAKI